LWIRGFFGAALAVSRLVRVELGFDAFAYGRRASPVPVPQGLLQSLLVEAASWPKNCSRFIRPVGIVFEPL
jgi:hypothetical protein